MNTVFRHETKFVCAIKEIASVYRWLARSPQFIKKQYPDRYINNIYFDSYQLDDASENLIGLGVREKLRLRWYGNIDAHAAMRLETKVKRDRLGTKVITDAGEMCLVDMTRVELANRLEQARRSNGSQVKDSRLCNPVVRNRYRREYFFEAGTGIRITIDSKQAFYRVHGAHGLVDAQRIDYPLHVIELKYSDEEMPFLRPLMSGFPLRPIRHSKYLAGLSRLIEHPYF